MISSMREKLKQHLVRGDGEDHARVRGEEKDEKPFYPPPSEPPRAYGSPRSAVTKRFQLLTVDEVLALPDPDWVVHDIMPAESLAQLYGESGLGKTFVALDLALSVAAGIDWLGTHDATPGPVVYVAAEGHWGMKKRVGAWLHHHGLAPEEVESFRLIGEAVPLGNREDVKALIHQIQTTFPERGLSLIVLDTQARCTVGLDENSAKEMGQAVDAADEIKRATGATVLLIHHSGYERDHARGSTAVHAALETQAKLDGKLPAVTLTCEKQKDDEEFEEVHITLAEVAESLVAISESDPRARLKLTRARLPDSGKQALKVLRDRPEGLRATGWEEASGMAHSTFYDARNALDEAGLIKKEDDLYFAVPLESEESESGGSKSERACSGEVRRSTHPLGGGPSDTEAEESATQTNQAAVAVEAAWEDSSRS